MHPLLQAALGRDVTVGGMHVRLPWPVRFRIGIVAGNLRIQKLYDLTLQPRWTVVDVGAHVGYNALYAAQRVGPHGRVIAVEPAPDNLEVLRANIDRNRVTNVEVLAVAADSQRQTRELYLRGEASAVNSFFRESFYAPVSGSVRVPAAPLDEVIEGAPDFVKIDVEGAELDVLRGMRRLLRHPSVRLLVEWHPVLQESAGHEADRLPHLLLEQGFRLDVLRGRRLQQVSRGDIARMTAHLKRARRPDDLLARRILHAPGA